MAITPILAMAGEEILSGQPLPHKFGWMSCRFSPNCPGLENCPPRLPPGMLLILDDAVPMGERDPCAIADELGNILNRGSFSGLLLDFQRPEDPNAARLVQILSDSLPCPMGVSHLYAREAERCPVFLPPVPPDTPVQAHLAPWQGREIWLEAALDSLCLTLTAEGCSRCTDPADSIPLPFHEDSLHCHYAIFREKDRICFTLRRTREDLAALLEEAEALGVSRAIGLYQELWPPGM